MRTIPRTSLRVVTALELVVAVAVLPATLLTPHPAAAATAGTGDYRDPSLPVAQRVDDLMSRMTLDDKVGQMTMASRDFITNSDITTYGLGAVMTQDTAPPGPNDATAWADAYDGYQTAALATPLGIPVLFSLDAVHGQDLVYGGTVFPHNSGMGATHDPALVEEEGRVTAEEMAGTGANMDLAPCVCVARNDRWGRTEESFGETPDLVTQMTSEITGLQGDTLGGAPASVMATAKHFIGDGGTTGGVNAGNTQMSEADLRALFLPPYQAALDRNVGAVMISYSAWNGVPMHRNAYLITDVLKGELGFSGIVLADYHGINWLDGNRTLLPSEVATAINAGIDMSIQPDDWHTFIDYLKQDVAAGTIPMSRIDDAVRRILTKKFEMGLFEHPMTDRTYTPTVGDAAHRAVARQAVEESQVLLQNRGGILPLNTANNKIFVAGKSADNIGYQSGGLTIEWQGASGPVTPGTSILQGIRDAVDPSTTVTYNPTGTGINGSYRVAIAVIGETPYAESPGDRPGSMSLDSTDLATLSTLRASGVPVVVVLVSGRPLDIDAQLPNWNALVEAWLPGTEGEGVADVLFGATPPTGTLPFTWMSGVAQQPINVGDGKIPLWPYGFGLSYPPVQSPSAESEIQAERYDAQSGTLLETTKDGGGGQDVASIAAGHWVAHDLDFGSSPAISVTSRVAAASATGTLQYRLDSATGTVIAAVPIASTGGAQTWKNVKANVIVPTTGAHRVYVTYTGTGSVGLNWYVFSDGSANAYNVRQIESYDTQNGTQLESTTDAGGGQDVGWIAPGDWLAYDDVNFGSKAPTTVTTRFSAGSSTTGTLQYRLDSVTGPIVASLAIKYTGGWQVWKSSNSAVALAATGMHRVFLTVTGTAGKSFTNLNWFQFNH